MNTKITDSIRNTGIVPVITLPELSYALPLAESLIAGNLPCAEITFRTACAAEAISNIKKQHTDILVGAGTILIVEQAQKAIDSGAQFIVSPGTNPKVVEYCLSKNIPIFPGVCTPTEIELALSAGAEALKFFPAEPMGGAKFLKALCAPYKHVQFIPTGGIDAGNIAEYLAIPQVVACGGSWMVKQEWLVEGNFDEIKKQAAIAVELVSKLRK